MKETPVSGENPSPSHPSTPRAEEVPSGSTATAPSENDTELDQTAAKLKLLDEPSDPQQQQYLRTPLPQWKPSDQIHVLGLDLVGRYVAHALAGCESIPPVRYLIHEPHVYRSWEAAGCRFTLELLHGKETIVHNRVIGEFIPRLNGDYRPGHWPVSNAIIENLVVTVPAGHVLRALEPIIHRLDHRSTICLVQDGLGIAEAIVDTYFPNELRRPVFILGHLATSLGRPAHEGQFAVAEVNRRKLYLTQFTPHARGPQSQLVIKRHPPAERVLRQTHMIRLMSAMPGLYGHAHPMEDWLRHKLLTVGFRAIADPLVTLFDCTYDKIADNMYAKQLMDMCLDELCNVVTRLPECRNMQKFRKFYLVSSLREQFILLLKRRKTADSVMRANTARGWDTDVDFLTGYFVRRGREVRVPVTALETLMVSVKSKQWVVRQRRNSVIPFEEAYPKTLDSEEEGNVEDKNTLARREPSHV